MKIAAIVALLAIIVSAFYAGHQAVRSWRASVAIRSVRVQRGEQ